MAPRCVPAVKSYIEKIGLSGRLEYIQGDVSNQVIIWDIAEKIGDKEGDWTYA